MLAGRDSCPPDGTVARRTGQLPAGRDSCPPDGTVARRTGQAFRFDPAHGEGSHGRVFVGSRFTTVRQGELRQGVLAAMLRQLDIDRREC